MSFASIFRAASSVCWPVCVRPTLWARRAVDLKNHKFSGQPDGNKFSPTTKKTLKTLKCGLVRTRRTQAPIIVLFCYNSRTRGPGNPTQTLKIPPQMLLHVSSSTPEPLLDTTQTLSEHVYFFETGAGAGDGIAASS